MRVNASAIWEYFTKSSKQYTAECQYCQKNFSYLSSISNLKRHLTQIHKIDPEAITRKDTSTTKKEHQEPGTSSQQDDSDGPAMKFSAEIYRQFNHEDDDAKCNICKEVVTSSMENMKRHLEENHADVFDGIISNAQNGLDSDNEDSELYTEVVYLEDEAPKTRRKIANKRRPSTKEYITIKSPKEFMTVDPPKEEKTLDEMEMFINYMRCLLKKVPKECTGKLQLDIINLIINAQNNQQSFVTTENKFQNGGLPNGQMIAVPIQNLPQQEKMYISLPNMFVSNNLSDITTSVANTSTPLPTNLNDK